MAGAKEWREVATVQRRFRAAVEMAAAAGRWLATSSPATTARWRLCAAVVMAGAIACRPAADSSTPEATPTNARDAGADGAAVKAEVRPEDFAQVLAMTHRRPHNRSRDAWRHPAETLAFFEVRPDSTVVELWPGNGWYTEILAPYLQSEGKLIVTVFDPNGPSEYYGTRATQELLARFEAESGVFGQVATTTVAQTVVLTPEGKVDKITISPFELAPPGSVDVVLTFRNSHGWYRSGALATVYGAAFAALKPGGVFGVEQHRAAPGADPAETAVQGYLPESTVIEAAEAVGFELIDRSEINQNPADTRDHPNGVWSLPPSLRDGDATREKYLAIGESDRMTLKFRKPSATP